MPAKKDLTGLHMWQIYVVRTIDNFLYTGISINVIRRFSEHCSRGKRSARYFKFHQPERLVFSYPIGDRSLALKVEYRFKRLPKTIKEKIIRSKKLLFDAKTGKIKL